MPDSESAGHPPVEGLVSQFLSLYAEILVRTSMEDDVGAHFRTAFRVSPDYIRAISPRLDEYSEDLAMFSDFSASVALAAAASTSLTKCNDGMSEQVCDLILKPGKTGHYRCRGHSPPHCYDTDGNEISPCP